MSGWLRTVARFFGVFTAVAGVCAAIASASPPQRAVEQHESQRPAAGRHADTRDASPSPATVRSVRALKGLAADIADRHLPVDLRATVTYYDPEWSVLFVQDGEAGAYVDIHTMPRLTLRPGDRVAVQGVSSAGDYAPIITRPRLQLVGRGALPAEIRPTYDQLVTGAYDSRFIRVDGVVQMAQAGTQQHSVLDLAIGANHVPVQIPAAPRPPADLVDARVSIRGVVGTLFNSRRQLVGVQLFVQSVEDVHVSQRSTIDPFELPISRVDHLAKFTAAGMFENRLRVQGVVTWSSPDAVFVEDKTGGVRVTLDHPGSLAVGDQLDVAGFEVPGGVSPELRLAQTRRLGTSSPVTPRALDVNASSFEYFDAKLVTVTGRVVDRIESRSQLRFVVRSGGILIAAQIDRPRAGRVATLEPGTEVTLTGVCVVDKDRGRFNSQASDLMLLLRGADDAVVTALPPFWTPARATGSIVGLLLIVCGVLGWVIVLQRHVTRQRQVIVERELREAALAAQVRDLVEHSDDMIYTLTLDGTFTSVNLAAEHITGYTPGELLAMRIDDMLVSSGRNAGDSGPHHLKRREIEIRTKHGERRVLEVNERLATADGEPSGIQGIARDVTGRRVAEQALRDSEARYRVLFDSIPQPIFLFDAATLQFVSVNQAAVQHYGYTRDEFRGMLLRDLWPEDMRERNVAAIKAAKEQGSTQHDSRHRRKDGSCIEVQIISHQVTIGGRTLRLALAIDVTERRKQQAELEQARDAAEAMSRAKSQFLANMSHELRTPMNGILGMTRLALETELTADQRKYLELVCASAEALLVVVNDVLDFSKIEAGKLTLRSETFDVRALLGETVLALAPAAHERGLDLWLHVKDDVPQRVVGDPDRLRQVVVNLLGNGIKFTSSGQVTLEVGRGDTDDDGVMLACAVSDTGIGIPADKQQAIFEEFVQADGSTTRQYGGTGLGLAISARLVQLLGGRITVESEVGRGSTFRFTVKMRPADAQTMTPATNAQPLRGVSIVVAVPSAVGRRALCAVLQAAGSVTRPAEDPAGAMNRLDEANRGDASGRVVLFDASGTDPEEAAAFVSAATARGAIVVRLHRAGEPVPPWAGPAQSALLKPPQSGELVGAVTRALGHAPAPAPPAPRATAGGSTVAVRALRVLLAEDHPVNQHLVVRLLERRGHSVTVVSDGRQAVETYQRDRFDVILMDVQMPIMDGLQATAEIRRMEAAQARHTPIIALTAHAMTGDRERCLDAGMDEYLAKPIEPAELITLINSVAARLAA